MVTDIDEKVRFVASHYGYDAQSRQCIEEMGELTQAINKFWRKQLDCGRKPLPDEEHFSDVDSVEFANLLEELADVQITLWEMAYLLNADITPLAHVKLNRQIERVREEERKE